MARVMELFVIVNALAGIATFLGVRFVWRRSRDATKRGFDIIQDKSEEVEDTWPISDRELPPSAGGRQQPSSREPSSLER